VRRLVTALLATCCAALATPLAAQEKSLTLDQLVSPSTVLRDGGAAIPFALHFFIEFESLEGLFSYIDEQTGRWMFDSPDGRAEFVRDLLERGVQSRVVSMHSELPREILLAHSAEEIAEAIRNLPTGDDGLLFEGRHWQLDPASYVNAFLRVKQRWQSAINCWSGSTSAAGRALSNWYLIEEGINLFGASYDSAEHFWQAVKYHPETDLGDLVELLDLIRSVDWDPWVRRLADDQVTYLEHGYAVEFLRHNLDPKRLARFAAQLAPHAERSGTSVRRLQQRDAGNPRFTALEEKILWGDLADVAHLIHFFSRIDNGRFRHAAAGRVLEALSRHRFDAIYLPGREMAFIGPEFQQLMLEIWKVKFLEIERLREMIRSTHGSRLLHFLNDGSSPDIPVPLYEAMLDEIREMALQ
jgi:hypothetical protein